MGMSVPERRVIVVGGGAAGMMASIFAGKAGARVTLLERGEKLGKKVYITGKGRCNVTNDCTLDEFLREVARNPRFLDSALSFFSPQDMMRLLEDAGCPVVVQRGRRVFPATEKASDVTRTLARLKSTPTATVQPIRPRNWQAWASKPANANASPPSTRTIREASIVRQ